MVGLCACLVVLVINVVQTLAEVEASENGRLEELPEATHWVQNDEPEKVNELLTEFLKREAK